MHKGITQMDVKVTEITRKRNSMAIHKRAQWRARYNLLTDSIRTAKRNVRMNDTDHKAKIELEGLQTLAQIMMMERNLITWDLRDTAYEWV